jgi:phospholipid/cholesterol/gamma-HCH transport system ATP-binding protein
MAAKVAEPVISLREVAVAYHGRRILDGVNLEIARGETMVLFGGSGSGKSTLQRQIIGLERPATGRVIVNDINLVNCSPADLKRVRGSVGVAFQSAALFNSLSIEEKMALPLREHTRLAESTVGLMVWLKLAVVGLADSGRLHPQALSWGMKKWGQWLAHSRWTSCAIP